MYVKGMYVCLGKQTYLENERYVCMLKVCMYVCMYVCVGEHTNLETRGMYVC